MEQVSPGMKSKCRTKNSYALQLIIIKQNWKYNDTDIGT